MHCSSTFLWQLDLSHAADCVLGCLHTSGTTRRDPWGTEPQRVISVRDSASSCSWGQGSCGLWSQQGTASTPRSTVGFVSLKDISS